MTHSSQYKVGNEGLKLLPWPLMAGRGLTPVWGETPGRTLSLHELPHSAVTLQTRFRSTYSTTSPSIEAQSQHQSQYLPQTRAKTTQPTLLPAFCTRISEALKGQACPGMPLAQQQSQPSYHPPGGPVMALVSQTHRPGDTCFAIRAFLRLVP